MAVSVLSDVADEKAKDRATLSELDRKLKLLNKPAVKSIKSEDGDIIDCVDINKQPAFDHPALRNHKIQLRPSFDLPTEKLDTRNESSQPVILQTWQKSGSCPEGTVPIRRIRKQDLLRAASLEQFGRKPPNIPSASNKKDIKNIISPPSINNTKLKSAILVTQGVYYTRAQGDIDVWNPTVDLPDDYTTAQIWLKAGDGEMYESIEAGWVVNPKLYGGTGSRLFTYWTNDSYKTTGCFDITCPGFVQTNPKIALGIRLDPVSSFGGKQYFLPVAIIQDTNTGNWWLKILPNYDTVIGYWPKELFGWLWRAASMVEWGGEVYSQNVKNHPPHTKTQMGSGSIAQTPEGSAAKIKNVRIMDTTHILKFPEWLGTGSDEPNCYSALYHDPGNNVEPAFYFGGPGQERKQMEKRVSMVLFLLLMAVSVLSDVADGKAKDRATLSGLDRKLKLLNKPAVKSIKSEDGDIIDCVDINKQPAFDHPALRNHKIQLRPSFDLPTQKLDTRNESSQPVILQTWQKSGSCPEGTVPIRRIRKQDLLRAASLEQFGTKPPYIPSASNKKDIKNIISPPSINNTKLQVLSTLNRSSAILVTEGLYYTAAQGYINLRHPTVDLPDDYTTAQIWLKAGAGEMYESIESGWMVNPKLYGDRESRFFVYWTNDSYKTTGCFDLTCAGFVLTQHKLALGVSLHPLSSSEETRRFLPIGIHQDINTGNWWLKIGQNYEVVVGYWPKELFRWLWRAASMVEWGGEVYSQNVKNHPPHTKTQMGSGSFAQTLEGAAASIQQIRIMDTTHILKYPETLGSGSDEPNCYSVLYHAPGNNVEPVFYFGGPGQGPQCN
ncbi:hypothetical protein Dsin_020534 [Dipteronia sinensis]|uniref:Neprosin PEP catalytic domain-containing protein n=1 Tax=Dipteronia sinensis TaxID=43782 RepID=A0AAE0E3V3_9ROSI|nr:hypothetical protein Dsin_020534 [Dipteronia sinensis]